MTVNPILHSENLVPGMWFGGCDLARLSGIDAEEYPRLVEIAFERETEGCPLTPAQKWALRVEQRIEDATVEGARPLESAIVRNDGKVIVRVLGDE